MRDANKIFVLIIIVYRKNQEGAIMNKPKIITQNREHHFWRISMKKKKKIRSDSP